MPRHGAGSSCPTGLTRGRHIFVPGQESGSQKQSPWVDQAGRKVASAEGVNRLIQWPLQLSIPPPDAVGGSLLQFSLRKRQQIVIMAHRLLRDRVAFGFVQGTHGRQK